MSKVRAAPLVVTVQLGISGSIHLPHPAFADLGGDGVGTEGGAWAERRGQGPLEYSPAWLSHTSVSSTVLPIRHCPDPRGKSDLSALVGSAPLPRLQGDQKQCDGQRQLFCPSVDTALARSPTGSRRSPASFSSTTTGHRPPSARGTARRARMSRRRRTSRIPRCKPSSRNWPRPSRRGPSSARSRSSTASAPWPLGTSPSSSNRAPGTRTARPSKTCGSLTPTSSSWFATTRNGRTARFT